MPGCAAVGCTNSSEKGYSMRKFPRDPDRRKDWADRTKRKNWFPTDTAVLCEVHFAPEMWEKVREDGKRRLKCNAVPTLFSFTKKKKSQKEVNNKPYPLAEPEVIIVELQNAGSNVTSLPSQTSCDPQISISPSPEVTTTPVNIIEPCVSINSAIKTEHSYANVTSSDNTSTLQLSVEVSKLCSDTTNDSSSLKDPESKLQKLKTNKELFLYRKLLQKKKFLLRKYKNKLRNANKKIKNLERKISENEMKNSSEEAKILRKLFGKDQIMVLKKQHNNVSTKFMKWSDETIMKSLKLKLQCGAAGYEALIKQNFPFPSIRTLQRKLHGIVFDSEVPQEVVDFLESAKVSLANGIEKDGEKKCGCEEICTCDCEK